MGNVWIRPWANFAPYMYPTLLFRVTSTLEKKLHELATDPIILLLCMNEQKTRIWQNDYTLDGGSTCMCKCKPVSGFYTDMILSH